MAVWRYCVASAKVIFAGKSTGNALADKLLAALKASQDGLSRDDMRRIVGGRVPAAEINTAPESQRLASAHVHVGRIGAILRAIDDDIAPQIGVRALVRRERDGIGVVGDLRGLAAGGGRADRGDDRYRGEEAGKSVGTHHSIAASSPHWPEIGRAAGVLPAIVR